MAERASVSAFFADPAGVDRALLGLGHGGVPRDRVEVVVSPTAGKRLYGKRAKPLGSEAVSLAALGALYGLFAGMGVSLLMVLVPGRDRGRGLYLAQLLGPNAGSLLGALAGALAGAACVARRRACTTARSSGTPRWSWCTA